MNIDQCLQEMLFKDLSTFTSCSSFIQLSGTIYANLVAGIMGNICVELFEFGPVIQDMLFKDLSTFTSCSSFVQLNGTIYANLVDGIMGNICVKII